MDPGSQNQLVSFISPPILVGSTIFSKPDLSDRIYDDLGLIADSVNNYLNSHGLDAYWSGLSQVLPLEINEALALNQHEMQMIRAGLIDRKLASPEWIGWK